MIFDFLGSKKKTPEEIEREKELDRAWRLYGKEVDAFLDDANLKRGFEQLEKSKAVVRPTVAIKVIREQDEPLTVDLALRVKRGEIQASKAYRFMRDPDCKALLCAQPAAPAPQDAPPSRQEPPREIPLSDDLKRRIALGTMQASKARRFMSDPELRKLL